MDSLLNGSVFILLPGRVMVPEYTKLVSVREFYIENIVQRSTTNLL